MLLGIKLKGMSRTTPILCFKVFLTWLFRLHQHFSRKLIYPRYISPFETTTLFTTLKNISFFFQFNVIPLMGIYLVLFMILTCFCCCCCKCCCGSSGKRSSVGGGRGDLVMVRAWNWTKKNPQKYNFKPFDLSVKPKCLFWPKNFHEKTFQF